MSHSVIHLRNIGVVCCYLDGVDDIVSVHAGSQFVDSGSVHILQSAEETSVQVKPVLLQATQVKVLNKKLQLIDDLIHLQTHPKKAVGLGIVCEDLPLPYNAYLSEKNIIHISINIP